MYDINEIKKQNKFDIWAMLYINIARSLMETCGRNGEGVARDAMRRLGAAEGKTLLEKHASQKIKTDLQNLYKSCGRCIVDPRVRLNVLKDIPEVQLWEVYACPAAAMWNKLGSGKLGSFFCEEYQYALVDAYTEGKGQRNLSMKLTCPRDNDCRFSMYYRAANIDKAQRERSFGEGAEAAPVETDDDRLRRMTIATVCYMLEAAKERFGTEGECAVANALKAAAKGVIPFLVLKASDTRGDCDREFLDQNFPVSIDGTDAEWVDAEHAKELFTAYILNAIKSEFKLN